MSWLIWIGAAVAVIALLLARKVARDAIRQDGKRVASPHPHSSLGRSAVPSRSGN